MESCNCAKTGKYYIFLEDELKKIGIPLKVLNLCVCQKCEKLISIGGADNNFVRFLNVIEPKFVYE